MALWHGKFQSNDPCNTLHRTWDDWFDATWAGILDDIILQGDMRRANMLYTRHQPKPFYRPLLSPAK
jgi:hypothetical protein